MGIEILVLGADEGLFDKVRDILGRGEQAALAGEFVNDAPLARINPADRRRGVIGKRFMARQILAVNVENRTDAERYDHDGKRQKAENRPEKA